MNSFRTAAQRVAQPLIFFFLCAAFVFLAAGPSGAKPDNPWHSVAVFDSDEDHAHHILEPSPFEGMSELQLAAVPRGNRIHYNAPSKCVPSQLKRVLETVAGKYGPITVNSTYRSPKKNSRAGGKKRSYHLKCAAVDFRVHASTKGLTAFLRGQKAVGGYKRYKSGFYHIDIGPKRTW